MMPKPIAALVKKGNSLCPRPAHWRDLAHHHDGNAAVAVVDALGHSQPSASRISAQCVSGVCNFLFGRISVAAHCDVTAIVRENDPALFLSAQRHPLQGITIASRIMRTGQAKTSSSATAS